MLGRYLNTKDLSSNAILILIFILSINTINSQTFYDKEITIESESINYTVTNYGKCESRVFSPRMMINSDVNVDILFESTLLVGLNNDNGDTIVISGNGNDLTSCSEWHTLTDEPITVIYNDIDIISNTEYEDADNIPGHQQIGLSVTQTTFSWTDLTAKVYSFDVTNSSTTSFENFVVGVKADFDLYDRGQEDNIISMPSGEIFINHDSIWATLTILTEHEALYTAWTIDQDPNTDEALYSLITTPLTEIPPEPSDYRLSSSCIVQELQPGQSCTAGLRLRFLGVIYIPIVGGIGSICLSGFSTKV